MPIKDWTKQLAYNRQWKKSHPERFKHYRLKQSFGITLEMYNTMFTEQKGLCLGCYKHQSNFKRALAVDHCHKTNQIRGLLCVNCPIILRRLAEYLEDSRAPR